MMGLIGFTVGILGFLLHQAIEALTDVRIERATEYLAVRTFHISNCGLDIELSYCSVYHIYNIYLIVVLT